MFDAVFEVVTVFLLQPGQQRGDRFLNGSDQAYIDHGAPPDLLAPHIHLNFLAFSG